MANEPAPSNYIVLCNLPHGLICAVGDKRIKLRGSANYIMPNKDRKFKGPQPQDVIYGATINYVEKKFWDAFVAQMSDKKKFPEGFAPFTNKQIVWNENKGEVTLMRRDVEGMKSGFEQTDPEQYGVKRDDDAPTSSTVVPRITE